MTMSLMVSVSDGIVLASDSRLSYTANGGALRIATDVNRKLWRLDPWTGVNTAGINEVNGQPVHRHIYDLIAQGMLGISWTAALVQYFHGQFLLQAATAPATIPVPPGLDPQTPEERLANSPDSLFFTVASMHGWTRTVDAIYLPSGNVRHVLVPNQQEPYELWGSGRLDIMQRLLKGYDTRLIADFVDIDAKAASRGIPYMVPLRFMMLQDAIDFAIFLVGVTKQVERFVRSTVNTNQNHSVDVGGPIDVLALTPDGVEWVTKKELHG